MGGLYLIIILSRAMSFALLFFLFKEPEWKWINVVFILCGMLLITLAVTIEEKRWKSTIAPIDEIWNPRAKEYQEQIQMVFRGILSSLKMKAILVGLILPCILVNPNVFVFDTTIIISTLWHLLGSSSGIVLCQISSGFCMKQNSTNGTNNSIYMARDEVVQTMFICNTGMLKAI